MKVFKLTALLACAGAAAVLGYAGLARSADHLDAPGTRAEPAADINDVYTWMDGNNVVLAMTVFPAATSGAKFSDAVKYVLHTASGSAYGNTTAALDVICTFDTAQRASCWAGTSEYVTGDASATTGLASGDGKFKVFAGLRADPFFFNLDGFKHTVSTVESAAAGLSFDVAGCPTLDAPTSATLRGQLQSAPDGGPAQDFFQPLNGLAIVVSLDKTLVTKGGPIVSAWAGTYN
jgi:hypothetical protein